VGAINKEGRMAKQSQQEVKSSKEIKEWIKQQQDKRNRQ
tara:strand:+ start:295 stop:411 length:117 start_codon:yes stop_codon:yes gene_type:complete